MQRREGQRLIEESLFPAGPSLIQQLLDDFLFRASRIIINSSNPTPSTAPSHDFHPKYDFYSSTFQRQTGEESDSNPIP